MHKVCVCVCVYSYYHETIDNRNDAYERTGLKTRKMDTVLHCFTLLYSIISLITRINKVTPHYTATPDGFLRVGVVTTRKSRRRSSQNLNLVLVCMQNARLYAKHIRTNKRFTSYTNVFVRVKTNGTRKRIDPVAMNID